MAWALRDEPCKAPVGSLKVGPGNEELLMEKALEERAKNADGTPIAAQHQIAGNAETPPVIPEDPSDEVYSIDKISGISEFRSPFAHPFRNTDHTCTGSVLGTVAKAAMACMYSQRSYLPIEERPLVLCWILPVGIWLPSELQAMFSFLCSHEIGPKKLRVDRTVRLLTKNPGSAARDVSHRQTLDLSALKTPLSGFLSEPAPTGNARRALILAGDYPRPFWAALVVLEPTSFLQLFSETFKDIAAMEGGDIALERICHPELQRMPELREDFEHASQSHDTMMQETRANQTQNYDTALEVAKLWGPKFLEVISKACERLGGRTEKITWGESQEVQ